MQSFGLNKEEDGSPLQLPKMGIFVAELQHTAQIPYDNLRKNYDVDH